ncbi:MAG: enoyl-CoA hydratase [Rhodospirillaceae bacterium]|nr:enoyl-CoA hydratase [Rhodospirillaceae bacterium]|tara:strand:+ start:1104 stop:1856 length:753 start_codon:yes stop_codon:yes gene_type:complete
MTEIYEENIDGIVVIKLNRPSKRNALNYPMSELLEKAFLRLNLDSKCKAIVLTGMGDIAFCAGMDLSTLKDFDKDSAVEWIKKLKTLYESIRSFNKPCIGAINGTAAGAGYHLALLCDLRIGCKESKMSQPEINVGLPSLLGPQLMFPTLGLAKTTELAYTGRSMLYKELLEVGLISELTQQNNLINQAIKMANDLAKKEAIAFNYTKQRIREITQPDFDKVFEQAEKIQAEAFSTGKPQETIKSKLNLE